MKLISFQFLLLHLFFLFLSQVICANLPESWIYSPQYTQKIDATDSQGMFSRIKVAKLSGMVFTSAGDSGIKVFDPNQNFKLVYTFKSTDHIEGFAVSKNGDYVFLTYNSKVTIFDFTSGTNFVQLGQDTVVCSVIDIYINSAEDIIYIVTVTGTVRILNISDKNNPTLAGSISWKSTQIYGGVLSADENWLLLGYDIQGLVVYKITKSAGLVTGKIAAFYPSQSSNAIQLTSDYLYVINLDSRMGICFADFTLVTGADPTTYPVAGTSLSYLSAPYWPSSTIVPSPFSLCLSSDNQFLFIGVRSLGIYVINISSKLQPALYQWTYEPFHGLNIKLSPDSKYLYFTNSKSFLVYKQIPPNTSTKYVSLFNGHLSADWDGSNTKYYWRCDTDTARKIYYGAFDSDGYWILDYTDPQNMVTVKGSQFPSGSTDPIDAFVLKNNYKTLLIPMNDGVSIFQVLDVTDLTNIVELQRIPFVCTGYVKDLDTNSNDTLLAAAIGTTIVFIDITTVGSYVIITSWSFQSWMKGYLTGIMVSSNDQFVICACRGYGYIVLDISNLNSIQMVNYVDSTGSENVFKSMIYSNRFYTVDGLQGLFILDQTKLPQLVAFSQLSLPGWTQDLTFMKDENTVIMSTMQEGMVYLLDIYDVTKPFIVANYIFENQNGMFTCVPTDEAYVFINNNIQIRVVPLKEDVYIHSELLEIQGYTDIGDMIFRLVDFTEVLKVGQVIKLNVLFLYQPLDLVVDSVLLYQSQQMLSLPYWIQYDPVEISMVITIIKDAVDPQNLDVPLLNVIIFKTLNPLYQEDFLFSTGSCQTDSTKSSAIYIYLQEQGYIDSQNLVQPNLDFNDLQQIYIPSFPNTLQADKDYNKCLSKLLKFTLLHSIYYTPVYLQIQSSLVLNIINPAQDYLQTLADLVQVNMIIPKFSGQFIFENVISVVVQINEEKNNINISGLTSNVNSFLLNSIIIFPTPPNVYSSIQATVTVIDQMNYDLVKTFPVTQFPFFVEKKNAILNNKLILSDQLNSDYSNGNIQITTEFSFQFEQDTFLCPDFKTTIIYSAFIEKNGKFVPLDDTDWIQFQSNINKFFGTPPQTVFLKSYTLKVEGFDGYTTISDTFVVTANQLPILFVINWIATILGPLVGALGTYKYRHLIYNIYFKKRNRFSTAIGKPNVRFLIKIPLISNEEKSSKEMVQNLVAKINGFKKTEIQAICAAQTEGEQIADDEKPFEELQLEPVTEQNEPAYQRGLTGAFREGVNHLKRVMNSDISGFASTFITKIKSTKSSLRKSNIEQIYLLRNGALNKERIRSDMIKYNIKFTMEQTVTSASTFKEEINNRKSSLSKCIKCHFARIFLKLDKKTYLMYQFLRLYSKTFNSKYTDNDWYKIFVDVVPTDELDKNGRTIVFPSLSIKLEELKQVLLLLDLITENQSKQFQMQNQEPSKFLSKNIEQNLFKLVLKEKGINLNLIKQILFADTSGIVDKAPNIFFPSCSESVYIKSHQLKSVESFKYSPGGTCFSLRKIINMDYQPYGPKGNMQFPNWLKLIMQPGVVILEGTPEIQHVEDILIRFYDNQGYIIRTFIIKIEEDQELVARNKAQLSIYNNSKAGGNPKKELGESSYFLGAKNLNQLKVGNQDFDNELTQGGSPLLSYDKSPQLISNPFRPSVFSQANQSYSPQQLIQGKQEQDLMKEIEDFKV